ncbi:MAG: ATP synthase F1 subunit epsilon [Polyangiales bacterium]
MSGALADKLKLEVATPLGLKLAVECDSVEARSVDGYFDVLPGHLPMLAALKGGLLRYHEAGQWKVAAMGPGFVEAEPDRVLILTDAFKLPSEVDVAAVQKRQADVNEKMRNFAENTSAAEYQELSREFDWLEAQIDAHRVHNS